MQAGWLLLWPLGLPLSHNRQFVLEYLAHLPWAGALFDALFALALPIVPDLTTTSDRPFGPAGAFVVVTGLIGLAYVAALVTLDRWRAPGRAAHVVVIGFTLLFTATLLFMPGLFSQDLFGYLVYGKIPAIHGLNPYIWPPSVFPDDLLLPWVAPIWRPFPVPYGPLWVDASWVVARLVSERSIVEQVLAHKALASAVHLGNVALVWWLLKRLAVTRASSRARLTAFAAFAWNPLVLFEVPGNGHNDGVMIALLLLGLVALVAGAEPGPAAGASPRPPLAQAAAMVCFSLSAMVKYLTGVAGAFLLLVAARQAPRGPARVARMLWLAAVGVLVAAALFAPWLELPDSLDSLVEQTGGTRYANALPDKVALAVSDHLLAPQGMGLDDARDVVRLATKGLTLLGFLAYLAWEARRVWLAATTPRRSARALAQAVARSTLVYILVVSVWVQTWYFALPLAAAVLLGWQSRLARFAVAVTLTALPCLYWAYYLQELTPDGVYALYAAIPLAVLGWGLLGARRRTRRAALADSRPIVLADADSHGASSEHRPGRAPAGQEARMGASADVQSA